MADNVTVTDGAYTADVLTDDCTTGHAQIVKLAISTDGSATLIPANGTDGILVNLGANNDVTVTGTVTAAQATAANLNMTEASAAATKTAVEVMDDWDESDRAKVNLIVGQAGIAGGTGVDGATVPRVTLATNVALPAGTNAIGKLAANSGVDIGDVDVTSVAGNVTVVQGTASSLNAQVVGAVAHDGNTASSPVTIGARAESALSGITKVADADVTNLYAGVDGVLIVRPDTNLEDIVTGTASNTDGASTQVIAASGSASIKVYLRSVQLYNASTSNIYVEMKDGTTAKAVIGLPALAPVHVRFDPPIAGTANTAWNFDPSAAATTVYCSAQGFKSAV